MFPCLTLLGYDKNEVLVKKLSSIGFNLEDSNSRNEGLEIKRVSPFYLIRVLAREFSFSPLKLVASDAPG